MDRVVHPGGGNVADRVARAGGRLAMRPEIAPARKPTMRQRDVRAMTCDHSGACSGRSRYSRRTSQLCLVLVCDQCGADRAELSRISYQPRGRSQAGALAELTARELGLPEARVTRVRLAALVSDVGRDKIPSQILNKRGPLSREEWIEVCRQPELGAAMLSDASFDDIRDWILARRERVDGSGYPRGLHRDDIPMEARLLAVAEAYVAMTDDRPHAPLRQHEEAIAELRRCADTQFDGAVVEAFVRAAARDSGLVSNAA